MNRVHGPLIGMYDFDYLYPPLHSIQGAEGQRYIIIQRSFIRDSNKFSFRTKLEFTHSQLNNGGSLKAG